METVMERPCHAGDTNPLCSEQQWIRITSVRTENLVSPGAATPAQCCYSRALPKELENGVSGYRSWAASLVQMLDGTEWSLHPWGWFLPVHPKDSSKETCMFCSLCFFWGWGRLTSSGVSSEIPEGRFSESHRENSGLLLLFWKSGRTGEGIEVCDTVRCDRVLKGRGFVSKHFKAE